MRAVGYYWVSFAGDWQPAHWDGRVWNVCALEENLKDGAFDAIDERQIHRFMKIGGFKLAPRDVGLIDLKTATDEELAALGLRRRRRSWEVRFLLDFFKKARKS